MDTVYVVIISDHHGVTDVEVFKDLQSAIVYARSFAKNKCTFHKDFLEHFISSPTIRDGLMYSVEYNSEGDNVVVIERKLYDYDS